MAADADANIAAAVDAALAEWRQGDCVLGEQWFVFRLALDAPLTPAARAAAEQGADLAEAEVRGLAVVSQTCDIVRSCAARPFVDVCPLVEVDEELLHQVERGRRPAYAVVPGLAHVRLVADLDRTMAVEKSLVAKWARSVGCITDADARAFAAALARKRARFAFPDDFVELARGLQGHLTKRHDKAAPEGKALRALREIRVQPSPSWDATSVAVMLWFIVADDDSDDGRSSSATFLDAWLKLVPEGGRFTPVRGQIAALEDMTAADYVDSDPLDLDHLSSRRSTA